MGTFISLILSPFQQRPPPRQPLPRFDQSLVQVLLQLGLGRQLGSVFGHGDAVFVHLQQFHLFSAGFGAQDQADGASSPDWRKTGVPARF